MLFALSTLLFAPILSGVQGRPVLPRATPETFELPVPAEGPGPTFDATATRVATGVQIRNAASPDTCFDVSDFRAGDFRFNLVPLALKPCDSSIAGQKFDLITKGEHNNNQDGTRTLIVSSQQFTCVDRRGNKNDRTRPGLFACGGRAVGDGETTADQQFFFNLTGTTTTGFTLVQNAVNGGVGAGNSCLTINKDGFVSNTPCSPPNFTPEQSWIIGDAAQSAPPAVSTKAPEEATQTAIPVTTAVPSSTSAATATSAAVPPSSTDGVPEKFELPKPEEGPGPTFDASATRAATGAHIRNAGSPDVCFDVSDFRAGDFRFNLVPLALKPCDATIDGQKFDLITKGEHNNVQDESRTLIVSSQQFTCVDRRGNINDRTRPGLFACGGRAAGDGETSDDQQYFFNRQANLAGGVGFPLVRDSTNNGNGPGNQCLTLNADGFLSNTPCSPPNFTPEQTWIVGDLDGSAAAPAPPSLTAAPQESATEQPATAPSSSASVCEKETVTSVSTVTVTATVQAPQVTSSSASITPSAAPSSSAEASSTSPASPPASTSKPEVFVLPKPEEGPGPSFDATATRAATSVQIRSAADPETCFDVSDFRAGDFRFNLVPLALKKCDTTVDGQKFDLITKGEHNDVQDESRAIIVSSQQLTCVDRRGNKNDRNRPGLFACGGRAAGEGKTSFDQQFFFTKGADLSKGIGFPTVRDAVNGGVGDGNQCLTLNKDGFLSNAPCSPPNFLPEQTWIVG